VQAQLPAAASASAAAVAAAALMQAAAPARQTRPNRAVSVNCDLPRDLPPLCSAHAWGMGRQPPPKGSVQMSPAAASEAELVLGEWTEAGQTPAAAASHTDKRTSPRIGLPSHRLLRRLKHRLHRHWSKLLIDLHRDRR
jgi:hypothetical protein